MRRPILFQLALVLLLAFTASPLVAQDWAKATLEKSPRHREYVAIKHGDRTVQAFVVYPEVSQKAPVVLMIHEIFGLSDWAKEMADEIAAQGYIVIAPDLLYGYGPKGGGTDAYPGQDAVTKAVSALDPAVVTADLDAAADYGKKLPSANGKLFVAGFCWGGGKSFDFAAHRRDLSAAFVFYGTPPADDALKNITAPVYGLYAGNDARITATVPATTAAMKAAGKKYESVIYDGAGHGFMRAGEDPASNPANKTARTEGFKRLIALLNQESAATAQTPTPATAPGAVQRPQMAAIGVPVAGMPFVHDPSTVVHFHGKYYVFSTGRGAPFYSSPDTVTWTREGSVFTQIPDAVHAAVPKNNGTDVWAPDIIRLNNQFYLYYAVSSWGSFQSAIGLATNPVLDPKDPAYKWTDHGVVVTSNGNEDLNAIDPGVILAPGGALWICYGSYHGSIRVTQLDPHTGLALAPNTLGAPIATARESEASDIISHDGFFYLFVNHGSCCKGKDSTYNIRVGRAHTITGPYMDRDGKPMSEGGGTLFLASDAQRIGPGHFGRVVDYDAPSSAPERFSIHYEADMKRDGRSVLDIRPLSWTADGWPIAGDHAAASTDAASASADHLCDSM
ncbi:MAG TPA: dienelactone hydrolase family protein [Acidobacteriaceae bacterium]|jgi:carboxymethylenebutenolidase|nr:dienelactone hydrolase family protein [Acidobacteriaceae bacterium]